VRIRVLLLAAAAAALAVPTGSEGSADRRAATGWTIRALPTLGGLSSRAFAISDRGQVAGDSTTGAGPTHATVWSAAGRASDLGTLGGGSSGAEDVNNAGKVVGTSVTRAGPSHGFLWSGGNLRDLGTLGGATSLAHSINDAGTVVGFSQIAGGSGHGFSWTAKGGLRDLGTLGGRLSLALAINTFGTVAGASDLSQSMRTAPALWRSGRPVSLGLPDQYDYGFAYGLSFAGQATGSLETTGGADAFLWSGGRLTDLGRLGDFAYTKGLAVNSAAEVVGIAFENLGGVPRAFIWRDGTASDLNTVLASDSQWTLTAANDINDLGQIVGYGRLGENTRAFVLTPPPAEQAANVAAFVRVLEKGSTAFERKIARLVTARKCAGLRTIAKLARKERRLGAVRRGALNIRVAALMRNLTCEASPRGRVQVRGRAAGPALRT
jgi:probable HAF family extracellular repeat protein